MSKYFYKLYDLELGCIGRYSTQQKAAGAEKRFCSDVDGDCATWIDKKEIPEGKTIDEIMKINTDNW